MELYIDFRPESVSAEQVEELRANIHKIDYELAAKEEKLRRHDVMAHVHTYGVAAPLAAPIIHLGATSCFVGDNADCIIMRDALDILIPKIATCVDRLSKLGSATCPIFANLDLFSQFLLYRLEAVRVGQALFSNYYLSCLDRLSFSLDRRLEIIRQGNFCPMTHRL